MNARTLEALGRELKSRSSCYAVVKNNAATPCTAVMRIADVQVSPYHPAFLKLSSGDSSIFLSQIQSIERTEDYYMIECGTCKTNREIIYVYLGKPGFLFLR